ncbi:MAG: hypothetical protein K6T90_06240 [Leptolyngbyaceae cyanobacterium HOT.MB2.61]|nr:hypothetical protein [Leptolyngbyaceae cyanobacterium HOT.MB2.61]
MTTSTTSPYQFLPWIRKGAATVIRTSDDLGRSAAANYQTEATLQLNSTAVSVPIHLYGPGDVTGLAPQQILRRTPAPGGIGFEPHYFPSLEFREADLPWRFTPTREGRNEKLRPWLILIALEQRLTVEVQKVGEKSLPAIAAPLNELPDLTESALWAHVQVSGPFPQETMSREALEDYIEQNPSRAIARLVCPRRLKPRTAYLVCLVPAFEVGRLAGLAKEFNPEVLKLQPAWDYAPESNQTVLLPVYDSWQFTTGAGRDFETVARALAPFEFPADANQHEFTIDPFLAEQQRLPLEGALRPISLRRVTPPTPTQVRATLKNWLNRSAQIEDAGGDPQVTPPLYGRLQANQRRVDTGTTPQWFDELNLDPRHRMAAAAGGDVVQHFQDEFIQQAWQQVGQLSEANTLRRHAQVAGQVSDRLKQRHFSRFPADLLLQVAGPAQARIRSQGGNHTIYKIIESSSVPEAGFDGAFRRLSRIRGPHLRHHIGGDNYPGTPLLFQQGFQPRELSNWQLVDAPNISGTRKLRIAGNSNCDDFRLTANVLVDDFRIPDDDKSFGFVFRYRDAANFYSFSIDRDERIGRLVRCVAGQFRTLWQERIVSYIPEGPDKLKLVVEGDQIRFFLGFNIQKLILDVRDNSHPTGKIGFYTWGNNNVRFTSPQLEVQAGIRRSQLSSRVVDEGTNSAPSQWTTQEGNLRQTSNIYSEPQDRDLLPMKGTYLKVGSTAWSDYAVEMFLRAGNDDAFGLMFRYRDANNFYRFSMDLQRSYQRLVKCVNGQFTLLWQRDEGFERFKDHALKIVVEGTRLRGYLNRQKMFDVRDDSHRMGQIAPYCWGVHEAQFKDMRVFGLQYESVINRLNAGDFSEQPLPSKLQMNQLKEAFLNEADGRQMAIQRIRDRLQLPNQSNSRALTTDQSLDPIHYAPELPLPLAPRLIELAPHLLLPGISGIPENSVTLLETNPTFVASFLVGANHEMVRELLWRGLNTDLRATVFRQFWDVRGGTHRNQTEAQRNAHKDIRPIHEWAATSKLAEQVGKGTSSQCVFLVRSELIRRFPQAQFYLLKAVPAGNGRRRPGSEINLPLFRGTIAEDMAYFGFDRSPQEVRSADGVGWYFVIEQAGVANSFGLDETSPHGNTLPNWDNLAWTHVRAGAYLHTNHLAVQPPTDSRLPKWGQNAAHMAAITLQKPVRVCIHADRLIPSTEV